MSLKPIKLHLNINTHSTFKRTESTYAFALKAIWAFARTKTKRSHWKGKWSGWKAIRWPFASPERRAFRGRGQAATKQSREHRTSSSTLWAHTHTHRRADGAAWNAIKCELSHVHRAQPLSMAHWQRNVAGRLIITQLSRAGANWYSNSAAIVLPAAGDLVGVERRARIPAQLPPLCKSARGMREMESIAATNMCAPTPQALLVTENHVGDLKCSITSRARMSIDPPRLSCKWNNVISLAASAECAVSAVCVFFRKRILNMYFTTNCLSMYWAIPQLLLFYYCWYFLIHVSIRVHFFIVIQEYNTTAFKNVIFSWNREILSFLQIPKPLKYFLNCIIY